MRDSKLTIKAYNTYKKQWFTWEWAAEHVYENKLIELENEMWPGKWTQIEVKNENN